MIVVLTVLAVQSSDSIAKPSAQVKTAVTRTENTNPKGQSLILPFAFSSESTNLVFGVGGMLKGFYQDQMTLGGAAYGGEDSFGVFAGMWDYRVPWSQRTFVSVAGMRGSFHNHRAYAAPRIFPIPEGVVRPGANESSADVFLESEGDSNWLDLKIEYVLPIGAATEKGMLDYHLTNGLLQSEPTGGSTWNPWQSGVTVLSLRQYNRYQSYLSERGKLDGDVHALELGLLYNNTDFPINPSRGSSQYLAFHYNPDKSDSDESWTYFEFEASKYFSFGSSSWARQRILALNFWTSYSPSWSVQTNENGSSIVVENPPFNEGATLGGYYRMKGFLDSRFHDKAAIYAAAEYRYTLDYNPVKNVDWLRFLHLDWFQVVGFVEAGRVGPKYDTDNLFKDVKTDFGIGLRAMTAGVIVRISVSHSDEGTNMWAMIGHPF